MSSTSKAWCLLRTAAFAAAALLTVGLASPLDAAGSYPTPTDAAVKLQGQSTGLTTLGATNPGATNYSVTLPPSTGTLAELGYPQTWPAMQTFNGGITATVTGHASLDLAAAQNFADLADKAAARSNLGLGGLAVLDTAPIADGGTGQTTANGAIGPSGLNIFSQVSAGTSNYTIAATARTVLVGAITAPVTYTLPLAASYPPGVTLTIDDPQGNVSGTKTVTAVPAGSDTINGAASALALETANGSQGYQSDGVSRWFASGGGGSTTPSENIIIFTSSGTYTPSPGMVSDDVYVFGAGGGGGGGALEATGVATSGGAGGGGAGFNTATFTAAQVGASQTVTVGAHGTGGISATSSTTAGSNGGAGGASAFGALLSVSGGGGGGGGQLSATASGGGGGGGLGPSGNGSSSAGGSAVFGATAGSYGGGVAYTTALGAGGGGGGSSAAGAAGNGGNSGGAAGGGAGGAGITATNTALNGNAGGETLATGLASNGGALGLAGAAVNGGSGGSSFSLGLGGGGGGGGASAVSGAAGNGGAGGFPGGGGGGGGSAQNGLTAGTGGAGGAGEVIVVEHLAGAGGAGGIIPAGAVDYQNSATGGVNQTQAAYNAQRISIVDFGCVGDGSTDSTSCILAAYNALVSLGTGTLYFNGGNFAASVLPTIATPGIIFQGAGRGATVLAQTAGSSDFLTVTNNYDTIRDMTFQPAGRLTNGFQIKVTGGASTTLVENVSIQYGYNGIGIVGPSSETHIVDVSYRYMLGLFGTYAFGSSSANGVYAATMERMVADNPYPAAPGSVITWSTSKSVTAGQIALINGSIWQAATSGTTATTGTGPSGLPSGTTPASVFTNTVTDGTVTWKFVAQSIDWVLQDSFAYSLRCVSCALLDGFSAIATTDSVGSGSSYPKFDIFEDLEADHSFNNDVILNAGVHFAITASWIGSSLTANGVATAGTFLGELSISGGTRIAGNAQYGVLLNATGASDQNISASFIESNSQSSSGTYHAIAVAAGIKKFAITNNMLGKDPDIGNDPQGEGVSVATGSSDYYTVTGNICAAQNVTGCVSDGGSGTHKTVSGNE